MCALPRAAAVFLWPAQSTYYWELADSLARGHGFVLDGEPVTFIEPLYPALLAVLKRLTADSPVAIGLLQAAIGAVGGVLLWRCAERLAGARAAFAAAAFVRLLSVLRPPVGRVDRSLPGHHARNRRGVAVRPHREYQRRRDLRPVARAADPHARDVSRDARGVRHVPGARAPLRPRARAPARRAGHLPALDAANSGN